MQKLFILSLIISGLGFSQATQLNAQNPAVECIDKGDGVFCNQGKGKCGSGVACKPALGVKISSEDMAIINNQVDVVAACKGRSPGNGCTLILPVGTPRSIKGECSEARVCKPF